MVLSKVADQGIVSQFALSFKINLAHDGLDHGGFTLSIFTNKGYLLPKFDGHRSLVKHDMVPIALAHVLYNHRVFARARGGRESKLQGRSIYFIYLDDLQLFEHFYSRLYLQGFGVGAFKAIDKLGGVGNKALLLLVMFLLLLPSLLTKFEVVAVLGFVIVNATHGHLNGSRGDVVYKGPVVGDDHHGFGFGQQKVFQPLDGFDVQVVGGLIQQDEVWVLQ